jgi:hypothetical protein
MAASVLGVWLIVRQGSTFPKEEVLAAFQEGAEYSPLTIRYHLSGATYPPPVANRSRFSLERYIARG